MTNRFIHLSEEAFEALFPLQPNHLNPHAAWSVVDSGGTEGSRGAGGCLYETHGAELDFIRVCDPSTVWTLIDADGELCVVSGCRFVDRLGYLVSTIPLADGVGVQVSLESAIDSGDNE